MRCASRRLNYYLTEISILPSDSNSLCRRDGVPLQGFSRFWVPGGAGTGRIHFRWVRNGGRYHFFTRFRRHVSLRHNVAIAICRTLHSPYPAGDGSIAILCSMLPESRRVR
jgi:hypothetical protein